jgi:serine/threonine protein kinase
MYYDKINEKNIFPSIYRELSILYRIRGVKGCMQLVDIYTVNSPLDPSKQIGINLVFPYYFCGDLYHYTKKHSDGTISESKAKHISIQLVLTLRRLHSLGIMHRDLKPENIIVQNDKYDVLLTDYGFAIDKKELARENKYTRVGTLEFYPIEMLNPCFTPGRITYDERVDIWSLGIVVFEQLYGRTPFYTGKEDLTKARIRSLTYSIPDEFKGRYPLAEDFFKLIFVKPTYRVSL